MVNAKITSSVRVNDGITAREVRLIAADGTQLGVKPLQEAMRIAFAEELDLVEVAAQAEPPVCRIMDYGKYKYEQERKAKRAKKKQSLIVIKEIKLRPKIDNHDFATKRKHVERFLNHGDKVKAVIMFRGREMDHTDLGKRLLDRLYEEVKELATIESQPKVDGRDMIMILAPVVKKEEKASAEAEDALGSGEEIQAHGEGET